MTDTTKALLARLNTVDVAGKTLPAFVTKLDADCQWLNGNEVCNRRRQGIVHDCRFLLVLIGGKNEHVEKCFERRDEANAVAKLAQGWGVAHAHVNFIHSRSYYVRGYTDNRRRRYYRHPLYSGLGFCDSYNFTRGKELHEPDDEFHAC